MYIFILLDRHIIDRTVEVIGGEPVSCEGMAFYSVILDYFKFQVSTEHFLLARAFLQQVYEVEEGAELLTPHALIKDVDGKELCKELGLCHHFEQENVARYMVSCLATSPGVIVVGPPASGKSAIIELAHALLGRTSCRKEYLHFSSYTEAQLIGEKEGILSRLLERKEEETLLLHIDGHFPESLALPLSLLADKQQFMDGEGRKVVPGMPIHFLLETDDLTSVSEAFLARAVVVDISSLELNLANLILEYRLSDEEDTQRKRMMDGFKLLESAIGQHSTAKRCQEMMDIYHAISTKPTSEKERMNYLVYSFFWSHTACKEAAVKIKECVEANRSSIFSSCTIHDMDLNRLVPQQGPLSQEAASWTEWGCQETQVRLAVALLRAHIPVLIVGERLGQQVFEEVQRMIMASLPTTKVHKCDLHALSTASSITEVLDSVLQRRGQSTLVPRESREIVLAVSDLSTPTTPSFDRVTSIIKDLIEPKKLFLDHGSGYNVQDVTLLCKEGGRGGRGFAQRFVCLYVRDNFEESVEAFTSQLTKKFPEVSGEVGKVAEAARRMLNTSVKEHQSLSMVLTSDIIVDLLSSLAGTLTSGEHLLAEFCRRLHQNLVSPAIDLTQQKMVQQWIRTSLAAAGITYGVEYEHQVTEEAFPADINLTEQQQQQAREVAAHLYKFHHCYFCLTASLSFQLLEFLHNEKAQFASLYGNYGYGKTIVLSVATDLAGYVVEEVKTLDQMQRAATLKKEKVLILLRDTYIEKSNMRGWLNKLMCASTENIHKVAFLMSPKSADLVPWQQWILSRTQVVGIPHWNDHSLKSIIDQTNFSEEVKDILTTIHKMTVRFCQDRGLNHECVSITSGHFVEILSRIEESVEIKINQNKQKVEDLKRIVKVMEACQESICKYQAQLDQNNQLIDTVKEELKGIKKNVKTLNEGLENLSKEVDAEVSVNDGLRTSVEGLEEKYRDIKEASFDDHSRVTAQIKALRPEEKFAFSKPLIVHEDVEKICSILMILLKIDVFGWKPFKDKFLSDDWQKRLIELDPDQCKHKQVFTSFW